MRCLEHLVKLSMVAILILVPPVAPLRAADITPDLALAAAERAFWGLPTDPATLRSIVGRDADVGTPRWGIPMSAAEELQLDLAGRVRFSIEVEQELLPYVQSLSAFGGAYFDQAHGGHLVVQLTRSDGAMAQKLADMLESGSRGVGIETVKYTQVQLREAAAHAWDVLHKTLPHVIVYQIAVDTLQNAVRLEAAPASVALLEQQMGELESELGVEVVVEQGAAEVDGACSARDNCHTPSRPGVRIYKGSTTGSLCTMGFHIAIGTDEQFLTAGHCGYSGSNSWFHPTLGSYGVEAGTAYAPNGLDFMKVQESQAQATSWVYAGRLIYGRNDPTVGEVICASLGNTNALDCGSVKDDWLSWTSSTTGWTVSGARYQNIKSKGGDSGSPIYVGYPGDYGYAQGILNTVGSSEGNYARVIDALNYFGASLYLQCNC